MATTGKLNSYVVNNVTRGTTLASSARRARNVVTRGIGLMFRKGLPNGGGLIIEPCNSVVCFFMRFPIDVVFLGRDGTVLHIIPSMQPWRTSKFVKGGRLVVELPAGTADRTKTAIGDRLEILGTP